MNKTHIVCIFVILSFIVVSHSTLLASPPIEPVYIVDEYMVEMRDGIHLATDVYLSENEIDPHGCVLVRTPYNKRDSNLGDFADAGWPSVVQDMRGRYASEGIDTIFRNAHTDGPDTLEWIVSQPWCNGNIATFGGSALGINQYYMAGANPPGLKCQYIQVATPNLHNHGMYQGGEFRYSMITMWLEGQQSQFVIPEIVEHENYTMDYWTNTSLEDNWQDVHVPAVHIGGWYDIFTQGTIDGFMGYHYLGGDGAEGNSKLIMGPWVHGASRIAGELVYPENSMDNFPWELFVSMIYEFCEDEPYETDYDYGSWPAVSYYVMGDVDDIDSPGNEWRFSNHWPLDAEYQEWYIHQNGLLSQQVNEASDSLSFMYDPTDPVPTVGGQNLCIPDGPYDQTGVEQRDDVLVFTSDVLSQPYEATGSIKARLYVSSDCPDTDFTVKLTDVYPDGKSMLITDGILRMRNRKGLDHWEFMEPDEIYEVEVDLWSSSYIWNTGHQIRISISSSNYPRFLANPNTKDPILGNSSYVVAENTVLMDGGYASCIILPYIEKHASNPPSTPDAPEGPQTVQYGSDYEYEVTIFDPDGDDMYVLFDWGDSSIPGWSGPYRSGETVTMGHEWTGFGERTLDIRVKVKDSHDVVSDWSDPLQISLPKQFVNPWIQLLRFLFERFPFLSDIPLFQSVMI